MTALEYMEKQAMRQCFNLGRETSRGAPEEVIENIRLKIRYYEAAAEALRKVGEGNE